jgi:hypothetical protein
MFSIAPMLRWLLVLGIGHTALGLDRVDLLIEASDKAYLEANPFDAEKVPASWITGGDTIAAAVSYRGAYSLRTLLTDTLGRRNWKVKTPKQHLYNGYREWNFNLEPHLRQKLSLDLFAAARVPAMPARHVSLYVNTQRSGTYLEFPDPDNKNWLAATWGSAAGDLFKAATDIPGSPAFFGETTDLGSHDSDYYAHYQKKTNNDSLDSLDYSRLRRFLMWVNQSSDTEFEQGLAARFDLHAFLRYLVVVNFVGHWDGYPNRGKNYWLYQSPSDSVWHLFPWDVDATFQGTALCLDNMGPTAGLFFMEWPRTYCPNKLETKERPLFERVMKVDAWRRMYLGEYQTALTTYLDKTALVRRIDSLESLVAPDMSAREKTDFVKSQNDIRTYLAKRTEFVSAELSKYPSYAPTPVGVGNRSLRAKPTTQGWIDLHGRRFPTDRLRDAPPGIYRNGTRQRVVF